MRAHKLGFVVGLAVLGCSSPPHTRPTDMGVLDAAHPRIDVLMGPTVSAATPPPAISGGTLLVTADDAYAVVSDPERDRIVVVSLGDRAVRSELALAPRDEPGRLVEDAAGLVHVVLRGGDAILTLDPVRGEIVARRTLCTAPRGIDYDAAHDLLHVACRDGALISIGPTDTVPARTLALDGDLRDVVVTPSALYVSRFRTAQVFEIDLAGHVSRRISLARERGPGDAHAMDADGAWRLVRSRAGVLLLHQRASTAPLSVAQSEGYGHPRQSCEDASSAVSTVVTEIAFGEAPTTSRRLACLVLGVDVAMRPDGVGFTVAAPGSALLAPDRALRTFEVTDLGVLVGNSPLSNAPITTHQRTTAVAYTRLGTLIAQTREPSTLQIFSDGGRVDVPLGGASRADTGLALFHSDPGAGLACASCHLEGTDDGRTWLFDGTGPRRTQMLTGGVLRTAPFHWDGSESSFEALMQDVFSQRMGGREIGPSAAEAVAVWVNALQSPVASPSADPLAVSRGRALFEDASVGCASCHTGDAMTNNQSVDVGTGGAFQVPSLRGVFARAPYMHDGCAGTLRARFDDPACGGADRHGSTTQLSTGQIDDLVAYLETL